MSQLTGKNRFKILVSFLALSLFFACGKDEPTKTEEEQPPTPPQAEYFIMDFNVFPDTTTPAPFQKEEQIVTYQNWGFAAANVAVWNSLITLTLIAPVATFSSTIQEEPVLQPDGRWLWTRNFNVLGVPHSSKLYGETVTSGVEWEMYLSKENAFTDFKWYTGFSNLPLTEGNWTLFKDPDSAVEFIRIDWHRNSQGSDIKYTNIIPDHPDNGGYIYFEKNDAASPYNRFYDIYNKSMDNLTQIEWDGVTREGRVLDALHFGDPDWHCWDMDLMDVICP